MKIPILILILALAGCQSAPVAPPVQPVDPAPKPVSVPPAKDPALESKLRQQAQFIEALISQNDALTARLEAPAEPAPYPSPIARALMRPQAGNVGDKAPPAKTEATATPAGDVLTPNADGVIDLTAAATEGTAGEPANPFAVRTAAPGATREITLRVSGILAGRTPCAVINDRLVQANDTVEALAVERIEPDAVCLRHAGRRLRVPVSDQTVKVKLPL